VYALFWANLRREGPLFAYVAVMDWLELLLRHPADRICHPSLSHDRVHSCFLPRSIFVPGADTRIGKVLILLAAEWAGLGSQESQITARFLIEGGDAGQNGLETWADSGRQDLTVLGCCYIRPLPVNASRRRGWLGREITCRGKDLDQLSCAVEMMICAVCLIWS
jgi:hypothetical protein